jgi:hypothetical protein
MKPVLLADRPPSTFFKMRRNRGDAMAREQRLRFPPNAIFPDVQIIELQASTEPTLSVGIADDKPKTKH